MKLLLLILLFSTALAAKEANYDESKVPPYTLPDVLTTLDGKKITSEKEWREVRRPEVLELFKTHVYGRSPARPEGMTFKVVTEKPDALDGKADGKQADITITKNGKALTIRVNMFIPKQPRPAPAFLLICQHPPFCSSVIVRRRTSISPVKQRVRSGPRKKSSRAGMLPLRSTTPTSISTKTINSRTASTACWMATRLGPMMRGVHSPPGPGAPAA